MAFGWRVDCGMTVSNPAAETASRERKLPGRRLDELDGLRGLAALWVVVFHLTTGLTFWLPGQPELWSEMVPFTFNVEGLLAVHLFFIISGFVICLTVEWSRTPLDFIVSRFARLYLVFWPAVALAVAVGVLAPSPRFPVTAGDGIVNLTMLHSYLGVRSVNPSFWSLDVELGFYGLMIVALCTGMQRRLEILGLAWVLVAYLLTAVLPKFGLAMPWRFSIGFALEFAGLFYSGLLFFYIWSDKFTWWRGIGIALCLVLRVSILPWRLAFIECAIFLLFTLAIAGRLPVLRTRPLVLLGAVSYSLYVVHQPLRFRIQLWLHAAGLPSWLNFVATLGLLIALSALLTFTVERPVGRFIRAGYARWKRRGVAAAF